jgi:hypothetical protein
MLETIHHLIGITFTIGSVKLYNQCVMLMEKHYFVTREGSISIPYKERRPRESAVCHQTALVGQMYPG